MSEPDDEENSENTECIRGGILPASEEVPDNAIHIDLTDDPESMDWLAEGRREDQQKSIFEMTDEELKERTEQTKRKIKGLKD